MTNTLRATDIVLSTQAFITGHIVDAIARRPLRTLPSLFLHQRSAPDRAVGLCQRIGRDGSFAWFGDPRSALPELAAGQVFDLALTAKAEGYESQSIDLPLSEADLELQPVTLEIMGKSFSVPVRTALPVGVEIALSPRPVGLNGRVVQKADPSQGIAAASIRVSLPETRGPVFSDANGYFTLSDLPVAAFATFVVQAPNFIEFEAQLPLDFGSPFNQRVFALE